MFQTICVRFRALTPLFGNGAGAFRIGKNSVVLTIIGKKYKVLCIEVFIVRLINLHGIVIFSEEQVDKQTKQIVNQCNNNRAICVCLIFFLSFELATSSSCIFLNEDAQLGCYWPETEIFFTAMTAIVEQSTI